MRIEAGDPGEVEWAAVALAQAAWRDDVQAIGRLLDLGVDPNATADIASGIPAWPWRGNSREAVSMRLLSPLMAGCLAGSSRAVEALAQRCDVFMQAPKWSWMHGWVERPAALGEATETALDCAVEGRSMDCLLIVLGRMRQLAERSVLDRDKMEKAAWRAAASAAGSLWLEACEPLARVGAPAAVQASRLSAISGGARPRWAASPAAMAARAMGVLASRRQWEDGPAARQELAAGQAILSVVEGLEPFGLRGADGMSALGFAAWHGLPEVCQWMLDRDPKLGEGRGPNALTETLMAPNNPAWKEAGERKMREAFGVLLRRCDARVRLADGLTPLMIACQRDALWAVEALLPLSDPLARDNQGRPAIEHAKDRSECRQRLRLFFKQRKSLIEREELGAAAGAGSPTRKVRGL